MHNGCTSLRVGDLPPNTPLSEQVAYLLKGTREIVSVGTAIIYCDRC